MKKTILILTGILIGLFVLLTLIDSSEYKIERRLWKIQKEFDRIAQDPQTIPDSKFDEVAQKYREIMKQFPGSKVSPKIPLQIGRVYMLKKDFKTARGTLMEILENSSSEPNVAAEAMANIAWTYELENNWAEALKYYEKIIAQYPLTEVGINVPIYISDYYRNNNNPAMARASYNKAVSFYKKISRENPDSVYDFTALRLLASAYFSLEDWEPGVQTLGKVLLNYPTSEYLNPERANILIRSINMISVTQLQNYDIALGIYDSFKAKYPDHPLNVVLNQLIKSLHELKDKNVQVELKDEKK